MAKLIVCRDYQSKKDKKTEDKTVVGYKTNLTKTGVENESKLKATDELEIEYKENMIVITKKK